MTSGMTHLDWGIIAAYMIGVVGIGVAAGFFRSRTTEGGHYFLDDRSLTWPIMEQRIAIHGLVGLAFRKAG